VRVAGESAVRRVDYDEAQKSKRHPPQQRFAGRPVAAPRYIGDEQPFESSDGDRDFMEQVIVEFQFGVLEEIEIADEISRDQGKAGEQSTRIDLRDQPDRGRRLVGWNGGANVLYPMMVAFFLRNDSRGRFMDRPQLNPPQACC